MRGLVVVSVAHCAGVCSAVGAHGWNINESNVCLAWPDRLCPGVSTAVRAPFGGVWCWERAGAWFVWVVFGALLGPEATGPFCSNAGGHSSGVSFVPASGSYRHPVWVLGVWLTGLLFENYIVDASI